MKKYFSSLAVATVISLSSFANPGDTTWVQANNVQLNSTTNFDTAIVFPSSSVTYRKILMVWTLGKYVCPAGSQYCGSWDYIVNNYVMTPGGDTMEISRLITPYATTGSYFSNSWTYNYVFDVSDYASILKGNATIRIAYGGYSYGFTANVRFAFIEGTPDRNVLGLQRLWHGQFNYGVNTDPITNHVFPLSATVPASTVTTDLKMRITGHGEDGNNCSEFCPGSYNVILNGSSITTQDFFRNTCGSNPISPQTGTWPYNRAGWCPGAMVNDIYNPLTGATGTYNVNVTFPSYTTVTSSSGNSTPTYDIEGAIVYYGGINKTVDASLEEILAPNNSSPYSKGNTICGEPVLHIHNSGSTAITSLSINYGIVGGPVNNYVWTGNIAALQDANITLPSIAPLSDDAGLTAIQQFSAQLVQVNGQTDNDSTNNMLISSFAPAMLVRDSMFVIRMKTSGVDQYNQSWQILDMSGNVVASRTSTVQKTLYIDTFSLGNQCYKLVVSTPDGYGTLFGNYWTGSSSDNGYFYMYKLGSSQVTLPKYYGGDFGSGFTQYFKASPYPAGVTQQTVGKELLEAYPNPANDVLNIDISGIQHVSGKIRIVDMLGRTMSETACTSEHTQISVGALSSGVYTLFFIDGTQPYSKLTTRLLIAK